MPRDFSKPRKQQQGSNGKPCKPPFAYYGAKQRLARKIVSMLPKHNAWVEGFCGSAAVTLAKPAVPIEIINDLDGEIVNLFRQLRDNSDELCRMVSLTPYASEELEECRTNSQKINKLERARRFLVRSMMIVNGAIDGKRNGFSFSDSYSRENREARVNRWHNLPERLSKVVERLRNVRIEKRDACRLLEMFVDRPATLVYLDPPYLMKRSHGYVIDANDDQFHEELLSICMKANCMILLSGYDNELYKSLLTKKLGWQTHRIATSTRDTSGSDFSRTEVFWSNRQFNKAKKSDRVPIRLNRKEKRDNKINPIRRR
jgi:DNA adenine methylase